MKRYNKNPDLTAEVIQGEWLRMGDIRRLHEEGDPEVIDRVKQLVKLSQGKYFSLNDTYQQSKHVNNAFIFADSFHDYPAVIVIPTTAQIDAWRTEAISHFKTSLKAREEILTNLQACHAQ
jgi:long-chain acyl-CoA synthetase